jgi:acetyl-CoA C-acetyltransferase
LVWGRFLPSGKRLSVPVGKSDVERFEINEAFAATALAGMQDLGISHYIVNVEGNSIVHGPPHRAAGAIQTTRLLHSMQRDGLKRGVVTMCISGGHGKRQNA